MLSDILPTGVECGVLNGRVQPGNCIAIVGAGPIGLAVLRDGVIAGSGSFSALMELNDVFAPLYNTQFRDL